MKIVKNFCCERKKLRTLIFRFFKIFKFLRRKLADRKFTRRRQQRPLPPGTLRRRWWLPGTAGTRKPGLEKEDQRLFQFYFFLPIN